MIFQYHSSTSVVVAMSRDNGTRRYKNPDQHFLRAASRNPAVNHYDQFQRNLSLHLFNPRDFPDLLRRRRRQALARSRNYSFQKCRPFAPSGAPQPPPSANPSCPASNPSSPDHSRKSVGYRSQMDFGVCGPDCSGIRVQEMGPHQQAQW